MHDSDECVQREPRSISSAKVMPSRDLTGTDSRTTRPTITILYNYIVCSVASSIMPRRTQYELCTTGATCTMVAVLT
jgi:hypothetical protein